MTGIIAAVPAVSPNGAGWPDIPEPAQQARIVAQNGHNAGAGGLVAVPLNGADPHRAPKPANRPALFSTDNDLDAVLQDITWLWPGWIPNGFPTLLIGDQEAGKSQVAQSLCHALLTGSRWPDGQTNTVNPVGVRLMWIDTEGTLALFRKRCKDWAMPRGHFILPHDPLHDISLDSPADREWIEQVVAEHRPPLVVLDALSGGHGGDENSNDSMKRYLKWAAHLASTYNIAVIIIHHLSKPTPNAPSWPVNLHRARGAGSISQFARSVLAVGTPNPADPAERVLQCIKLNLAPKPDPVGYRLTDYGPAWGKPAEIGVKPSKAGAATAYLLEALREGPHLWTELEEEAITMGVCSASTLKKARGDLGCGVKREKDADGKPRWWTVLPNWQGGQSQDADDGNREGMKEPSRA